ncbi:WhiB family transcriptional regulator [Streptomyces xanthochromogenes]|uniref:WhiB family transcriptional regulator n=1 Tax=Streptomyces xanthochromogenes TaxID=67384 RepID=UPI00381CCBC5
MSTSQHLDIPDFVIRTQHQLPCTSRPELFHIPEDGRTDRGSIRAEREARAKQLCGQCPIQAACRDWGRSSRESGIWGGETEDERAAAGFRREKLPGEDKPDCGSEAGAKWHRRYGTGRPCEACAVAETEAARRRRNIREAEARTQWPPKLTPVELRVLEQIVRWGRPNNQIAKSLGVKTKSVTTTVYRLRTKLRTDNAGFARAAHELGLLATPDAYRPAA